ncbi:hypothetical protein ABPG73_022867 [Tetrahymena malaccensis]
MNKLLANIGIIAITVSSVLGLPSTPGQPVLCGTPNPGQTADANNVCQTDANNVQTANNSKSSAAFLALAYTILLLCVFF